MKKEYKKPKSQCYHMCLESLYATSPLYDTGEGTTKGSINEPEIFGGEFCAKQRDFGFNDGWNY